MHRRAPSNDRNHSNQNRRGSMENNDLKYMKVQATNTPGMFMIVKNSNSSYEERTSQKPVSQQQYRNSRNYSNHSRSRSGSYNSSRYYEDERSHNSPRYYEDERSYNSPRYYENERPSYRRVSPQNQPRKKLVVREEKKLCFAAGSWTNIPSPDQVPIPTFLKLKV